MTEMHTTKDLQDFAASAAIWDLMAEQALPTSTPGDGRVDAFEAAAERFRREFDRIAKGGGFTPEEIDHAKQSADNFKSITRREHVQIN